MPTAQTTMSTFASYIVSARSKPLGERAADRSISRDCDPIDHAVHRRLGVYLDPAVSGISDRFISISIDRVIEPQQRRRLHAAPF